jgi:hypothetical protein
MQDPNARKIEDYGSPATDELQEIAQQNDQGYGDRTDNDVTPTTNQGVGAREAADKAGQTPRFGEFEDTGVGVDLTERMEEPPGLNVREEAE